MAQTVRSLFAKRRVQWLSGLDESPKRFFRAFIRRYLEQDARGVEPCPMPILLSEIIRGPPPIRRALAAEMEPLLDEVTRRLGGERHRHEALNAVALSIGALTLSRAFEGTSLEGQFTRAATEG
jgi:hypothetical protein